MSFTALYTCIHSVQRLCYSISAAAGGCTCTYAMQEWNRMCHNSSEGSFVSTTDAGTTDNLKKDMCCTLFWVPFR